MIRPGLARGSNSGPDYILFETFRNRTKKKIVSGGSCTFRLNSLYGIEELFFASGFTAFGESEWDPCIPINVSKVKRI